MDIFNIILQIICVILGFIAQILIGNKNKFGFVFSIINNVFWAIFFLHNQTYIMLITVGMFFYTSIRGFILWGKCKPEIDI